jgi:hypothetical protein
VDIMQRLGKIFASFLIGGIAGAIVGAIGGMFDRGSLFIMVPSGPPAWAIFGAFVGCLLGLCYGAFAPIAPQGPRSGVSEEIDKDQNNR